MSNNKTPIYWIIQIVVWSLLGGALLLNNWIGANDINDSIWRLLMDSLIYTTLAILFSHLMKILINRYCAIDNLKWIDLPKIFGIVVVCASFLYLAYTLHIQVAYRYLYKKIDIFDHQSQSLIYQIVFFLNSLLYFIVWVIFYIGIKGLIELNICREERIELESILKESQLNTLKGQINPHFMFNSLNNIRGLMLEDVNSSREMLTRLSELLRYSLTKNSTDSISLKQELEMVENFVSLSKIQFEERLNYTEQVDPALISRQIPPMIIQLLVENAVKHGISNLKEGGSVFLEVLQESENMVIRVTNSGKLSFGKKSTKLGLDNIRKRLKLLYGSKATFSIWEKNKIVIAEIKIP